MTDRKNCKQLAEALGRGVRFIYDMRRGGFPMPSGYATVQSAEAWLTQNPKPSRFRSQKKSVPVSSRHKKS